MIAKLTRSRLVMIDFTCQLDWSQGAQKTLFLGVSVSMFPDEISI